MKCKCGIELEATEGEGIADQTWDYTHSYPWLITETCIHGTMTIDNRPKETVEVAFEKPTEEDVEWAKQEIENTSKRKYTKRIEE